MIVNKFPTQTFLFLDSFKALATFNHGFPDHLDPAPQVDSFEIETG